MNFQRDGIAPNAGRLLWAGFFAILAAGIGFGIRANIAGQWRADFGFPDEVIGTIGSAGFPGFCFGIIAGGLVCDRLGYGRLIVAAFVLHLLSAVSAFFATTGDPSGAERVLWWGTFVFGFANGTLEAVANPLVATLFPQHRTHYLNILHASWPAGLVLGSLVVLMFPGVDWRQLLAVFLVATLGYGLLFLGQTMPKSEAKQQGLGFAAMFRDVGLLGALVVCALLSQFFAGALGLPAWVGYTLAGGLVIAAGVMTNFALGSWLLFTLFAAHLLVGAVELGTDFWAADITGNFLTPEHGRIVFVFTSAIMFSLRFCAGFLERHAKLSPVGILLVSAVLACVGLNLASGIQTLGGALLAMGVYAIGKTFFWPTMLAVASDRFPRTGAIAISMMGGIGMLSAGVIGGPGLGYAKDRFAGAELQAADAAVHAKYEATAPSRFLFFDEVKGIDGKKLAAVQKQKAASGIADTEQALATLPPEERTVLAASIAGDRKTLRVDSLIPAAMAALYLLLALWFKSKGGYRALKVDDGASP